MSKNPPWRRDELILALALYFEGGRKQLRQDDPRVEELSRLLKSLPIHPKGTRVENFRSHNSVSMKLGNFLSLDPEYTGLGLYQASKLDQRIWNEFSADPRHLTLVAQAIRDTYREITGGEISLYDVHDDEEFLEGRILARIHKQRERNRRLAKRKKEVVLAETGRLACEVCGFDFGTVYGAIGHGFAECHHLTPLSQLRSGQKMRLSDLAIVCANCHRMLHRGQEMLTIEELRGIVRMTF